MNKAFKKIKDQLQRRDNTVSRDVYESTDDRTKKYYAGMCYGLRIAKEIVREVEKEYAADINVGNKEGKDTNVLASSPEKTDEQVIFTTSSRCKVKCKNCSRLYEDYDEENEIVLGQKCDKIIAYPDVEMERYCIFYKPMTNGDRIRRMKDEELAEIVFCPYDTAGENIMPCVTEENKTGEFTGKHKCNACMLKWLKTEEGEKVKHAFIK